MVAGEAVPSIEHSNMNKIAQSRQQGHNLTIQKGLDAIFFSFPDLFFDSFIIDLLLVIMPCNYWSKMLHPLIFNNVEYFVVQKLKKIYENL